MKTLTSLVFVAGIATLTINAFGQPAAPKMVPVLTVTPAHVQAFAQALRLPGALPEGQTIQISKMSYSTPDTSGRLVPASGAIAVPSWVDPSTAPVVLYHHGTKTKRDDVPSTASLSDSESMIGMIGLAGSGFIVLAPDYLGFGESQAQHPYLHVQTQGSASLDFMKLGFAALGRIQKNSDCTIIFSGFSQGGHATMSSQFLFEKEKETLAGDCKVNLVGNVAISGPHDLSDTTTLAAIQNPGPATPLYSAYSAIGMKEAYPTLDLTTIFQEDTLEITVQSFREGKLKSGDIAKKIPMKQELLFKASFISEMLAKKHPLYAMLKANNLYDWTPKAPVIFVHGQGDHDVPFQNSVVAYDTMKARGAKVQFVKFDEKVDHGGAFVRAIFDSKNWMKYFQAMTPKAQ
ncbi:MAG: prolyl oligopeptidase family serine peptidase [Bdellovibrionales bacterium]|nr:prolyl oligopeptidase family serine peptidase [Bdellovibrionales bacterium]